MGLRKLEALLRDAVSVRLEADVPLGFFVSGGIDSSLVLALADSECTRDRVAITARFGGAQDDADFRRAELATQQAHIWHTIVDCEEPRLEDLPALIAIAGEPLADPSLLPSAAVCRAARRDVTVALTGDGGDELFCGYNRVASVHLAETIRRRFGSGGLTLSSAAGRLSWLSPAFGRLSTVASFGSEDLATLYAEKGAAFPESERRVLYRPGLVDSVRPLPTTTGLRESVARFPKMSAADGFLRLDLQNRLAGRYLQKLDVASSAAGLECRSPFVDQHLVESAMSIPAAAKMPWGR
ncbi:MAG: hypothetical protein JF601_13075, partial [Acidobacteria bacterium]|nr:hypothetical protein [Acidobacteriota bacterium]